MGGYVGGKRGDIDGKSIRRGRVWSGGRTELIEKQDSIVVLGDAQAQAGAHL